MGHFQTIVAAFLAVALPSCGATAEQDTLVLGIGARSCAYWLSTPPARNEGRIWIMGFWSGWNLANDRDHQVGRHTDVDGKVALVQKECDRDPSMTLMNATARAYNKMDK
jgi:hypothetical protein